MTSPENNIVAGINNSLGIELQESISMDELKNLLAGYIHHLISGNFNKLVSILYRIDINEVKLKQLLENNPAEDAGRIIAELIIQRQIQKIKSRKENESNNIIPEDDKW